MPNTHCELVSAKCTHRWYQQGVGRSVLGAGGLLAAEG